MSQGYRVQRRDPEAAKAKRIEAARVRKALAICDVLWALGCDPDQAEHLPQAAREQACKLTGRKGDVSHETWVRVVSTLQAWSVTRPPESRGGAVDLIARLGGPAANVYECTTNGNVFDDLAQRGLAAKALDTLMGDA